MAFLCFHFVFAAVIKAVKPIHVICVKEKTELRDDGCSVLEIDLQFLDQYGMLLD